MSLTIKPTHHLAEFSKYYWVVAVKTSFRISRDYFKHVTWNHTGFIFDKDTLSYGYAVIIFLVYLHCSFYTVAICISVWYSGRTNASHTLNITRREWPTTPALLFISKGYLYSKMEMWEISNVIEKNKRGKSSENIRRKTHQQYLNYNKLKQNSKN